MAQAEVGALRVRLGMDTAEFSTDLKTLVERDSQRQPRTVRFAPVRQPRRRGSVPRELVQLAAAIRADALPQDAHAERAAILALLKARPTTREGFAAWLAYL